MSIFKRLVNLARAEVTHYSRPDFEISKEFMDFFRTRPEFSKYSDYFEAEFRQEMGDDSEADPYSQSSYSNQQHSKQHHSGLGYDPYVVLEVSHDATYDEIEKAYKKMARKNHPDRFQDAKEREVATRLMAKINASFDFIKRKHGKK